MNSTVKESKTIFHFISLKKQKNLCNFW